MLINRIIPIVFFLFIVFFFPILATPKMKVKKENVPFLINWISSIEVIFGILILFGGIILAEFGNFDNKVIRSYVELGAIGFGFLWFAIAIQLYHGNKSARKILLVLSVLRIPTLIGIIFSLISIYVLCFNKNARKYFKTN